ncbi:hypothetical protein [Pedobacter glucosidilyticus]|uniref:hypothetical protein n=1 Tax=Pedobacter glucosidilyticus TaxID=1122941 RepID=UPI00042A3C21|nr:hypothetical protein [Pedobacter glucosidilyticus]
MNKKKILIFGLLALIFGGLLAYYLINKKDQNQLIVTVDSSLSSDKIRIDQGFYSINEGSDENLIKMGLNKVVYKDSKETSFETICGENDFLVVYDNEYYSILRHFIPNDFYDGIPEPHTYNFDFKRNGDKINLTLHIEGEDGEKFERVMEKVADAKNNIWGRQIEK